MHRAARIIPVLSALVLLLGSSMVPGCGHAPFARSAQPITTASMMVDYPFYRSAEELVDSADVVIVGVVVAAGTRDIDVSLEGDPLDQPYLVSTVEVQRVIKGGLASGDTIEVKQLLSADAPRRIWLNEEGMRAILFLVGFADVPYSPLNPLQGVVLIEKGQTKAAPDGVLFATPRGEEDVVTELAGFADQ